jgi:nicotinate-nucleotide adenylyltransferase
MQRLGIYGGSFDPVHHGHLLVARAAREELALDRLFFVPAAQSPFKADAAPAPAGARLRLLRLALAGWSWCAVDDQEVQRAGVSFTVDTLRDYAARFPGVALFYLIGADNVPTLPHWRAAEELARLAEFVVVPRPGETTTPLPPPFRGRTLRGWPFGVSSSEIRDRLRAGLPVDHLVPPAVAEALAHNPLYLGRPLPHPAATT